MEIKRLKANHQVNPLGYDFSDLTLSWVIEGEVPARVLVEVSEEPSFGTVIFAAENPDPRSLAVPVKLKPRTRYYWRVKAYGIGAACMVTSQDVGENHAAASQEGGGKYTAAGRYPERDHLPGQGSVSPVIKTAWFETAKEDEPWQAKWISPVVGAGQPHPKVSKTIEVGEGLTRARIYAAGLGLYELYIDGVMQGEEYFLPGFTKYDSRIQYNTFDVTDALSGAGSHRVEIMLGNGWYKGWYSQKLAENIYGDRFLAIAEIHLDYAGGRSENSRPQRTGEPQSPDYAGRRSENSRPQRTGEPQSPDFAAGQGGMDQPEGIGTHEPSEYTAGRSEVIVSDETWEAASTAVADSSIYNGEVQDNTLAQVPYPLEVIEGSGGLLEARSGPPVTIHERLTPIEVIHTPAGETVLDMGQNMVGWVAFTDRAMRGHRVTYRTGEILRGGNFYRDNLLTSESAFSYTSDGSGKLVRPHFTFFGFRYVKLENWPGEVRAEDFTGCVIHSDLEEIGQIKTADARLNQLFHNVRWSQKGNFLDIPTDCPQRDERMGWTGDAQVFSGTACFNYDTQAFYAKFCRDMYEEQMQLHGAVPYVVPMAGYPGHGSTAWGDAAVIIPWNVYLHYGDARILRAQYPGMKAWVDYMHSRDQKFGRAGLWDCDFHFADWLAPDGPGGGSCFGGTDPYLVASCYYSYSAGLTARAAGVLGRAEDAAYYESLAEQVRKAVCREFLSENGRLCGDTMTGYVILLYMEIAPEKLRPRLAARLAVLVRENGGHLATGFVGTPYLCRVLSDYGYNDLAWTLLLQEDCPGWLYEVKMGATTIWERWDSLLADGSPNDPAMNSFNHYAYGSIAEWMYRYIGGIRPCEDAPGFRRFYVQPQPDIRLPQAEVTLESASGYIRSRWSFEGTRRLSVEITVPAESEAIVILPDADAAGILAEMVPLPGADLLERDSAAGAGLPAGGSGLAADDLARSGGQAAGADFSTGDQKAGAGLDAAGAGSAEITWFQEKTSARALLPGGSYRFSYELTRSYERRLSVDLPIDEVMAHEEAKQILTSYSELFGRRWYPFSNETGPLREILESPLVCLTGEQIAEIEGKLNCIAR